MKHPLIFSVLISAGILAAGGEGTGAVYKDHLVIQLPRTPKTDRLVEEFDVWASNSTGYQVRVTQEQLARVKKAKASYKVLVPDVQELLKENWVSVRSLGPSDWFEEFHQFEELVAWYSDLATKYPSAVRFVKSIGKSAEGRDMPAVRITNPNGATKKRFWFESLIHAREWITGSTLQYVLNHFVENRESDPAIKSLLDRVEIVAVPVVNPDGYSYSWTNERFWRKNRRVVKGGVGVDLNRNFPYHWGKPDGASKNPKSESYQGPNPASEPEVQNILRYYQNLTDIVGAIDFHSYSQILVRPYGITGIQPPDEANLVELGDGMVEKISQVAGRSYTNLKASEIYEASGLASDWFYGDGHKAYGYAIELSPGPDSKDGFVLPSSEIIPVGKDIVPAIIHFITYVLEHPLS